MDLWREAQYFGIDAPQKWIEAKKFQQAMQVRISTFTVDDDEGSRLAGTHEDVEHHPAWRTVKRYLCPRRIIAYYDEPKKCGRACANARGDGEDEYEEEQVCKKETIFDLAALQYSNT